MKSCIFCKIKNSYFESDNFKVVYDEFPVNLGHSLIIPKKHIIKYEDISDNDIIELHLLIKDTKNYLQQKYHPNGFNIGFNEGKYAGQTIEHFHIHIIPRYKNDIKDPRGGIRCVIPEKKIYDIDKK